MSVTNDITNAASATAQYQASQPRATGAASQLGSQEFMNLMMKQLQYQDPMAPVSNAEFIAQQAQFSQLSTTQEMSKNISMNNSIMQTLALVGKEVTMTDPNHPTQTITGVVSEAKFTNNGSSLLVNGKEYPISLVKSVKPATIITPPTPPTPPAPTT